MQSIYLFIRSVETTVGLLGMFIALSKNRENFKTRLMWSSVIILVFSGLLTCIYILTNKNIAELVWLPILLVSMLSALILVTADRWQILLFNFFTNLSIYILITYVSNWIALFISGTWENYYHLLLKPVLFAAVISLEFKYVRKPFRYMVDIVCNEWSLAIVIAGGFFVLNILLNTYPVMFYYRPKYNYLLIVIAYILMAVVYYCFYIILQNVSFRYEKEQIDAVMNLKLSSLEHQINMQSLAQKHYRRTSHDLRHNCLVVIGQINSGDYTGALAYLKQFIDLVEPYSVKSYCKNNSINYVLSALAERAEKSGIAVDIKVRIPEKLLVIGEVELASLVANAFENAIEGCIRVENSSLFIRISADYTDHRVLLSVKNSCGEVRFADGLPMSSKPGGGTGTKSIAYIAEKYHGMTDFDVSDQVFTLQAYLLDE